MTATDEAVDFSSTVAEINDDIIQGNFDQLLRLRVEDYPALAGWLSDHKHMSVSRSRHRH